MTVANTDVSQLYLSDGANLVFAIPFSFVSGDAPNVTRVVVIDNLGVETVQVLTADYTLQPAGDNPTDVVFNLPVTNGFGIRVERISPRTQPQDLNSGGANTPYSPVIIENQLDRLTHIVQEIDESVSALPGAGGTITTVSGVLIPDWETATAYVEDQVIIEPGSKKLYRATTDHISNGASFNADFVLGRWELVETEGVEGPVGPQGMAGVQGLQGIQGNPGADGADGADGIFSEIASQLEAEAGVDNGKGMTPLRTAQAIEAQIPNDPTIVDIETRLSAAEANIQDLQNRVINLEAFSQFAVGRFAGSQKIINNQAVPVELLGKFNATPSDGKGDKLLRTGNGSEFAKVMIQIRRINSLGVVRFSSFDLIMHYVNSTWFIQRDGTDHLVTSLDLDGITLSVDTNLGTTEGQVSYISDDMGGDPLVHFENSEIKWLGQEIPVGV